jgi:hypothetical protein
MAELCENKAREAIEDVLLLINYLYFIGFL